MKRNLLLGLAAGWTALLSMTAFAGSTADYVREKKWADEVIPGLVVGDPVYLQTPRGHHKFLALFTPAAATDKAAIVVHGMGIHPDWGMVGTLRTELADRGFSASMMTEALKGRSVTEAMAVFERFHHLLTGGKDAPSGGAELGKLAAFSGVREFPDRVKCATLAWHTLRSALDQRQGVVSTE